MNQTIYARSSGAPPAAIGIIRISGPDASTVLRELCGVLPAPRQASLRRIGLAGEVLDEAVVLWFPGPRSATGEDCAELHCHGGRAVLAAVERAVGTFPGVREAQPGEFTRRAFLNGRMDLAEAEGLADLLAAETESQRRAAQEAAGGHLSREVDAWRDRVLMLSARIEAAIDFSDEDDVSGIDGSWETAREALAMEIAQALARPPAERLREGIRVVLAGPPNAGKSSLFNALVEDAAAIVSHEAGTTRDAIERPLSWNGIPFVLVDTAGLRGEGAGEIEQIGISRAQAHVERADIVLWLGAEGSGPPHAIEIASMADVAGRQGKGSGFAVSAVTRQGVAALIEELVERARVLLPKPGMASFNARQRQALEDAESELRAAVNGGDLILIAEHLRAARLAFDRLTGRASTEDMLDALFGRFCIGK